MHTGINKSLLVTVGGPAHRASRRSAAPPVGDTLSFYIALASPSGDTGSPVVISHKVMPSGLSSLTPLRFTTVGVPLVPVIWNLGAWLALTNLSHWLIRTV